MKLKQMFAGALLIPFLLSGAEYVKNGDFETKEVAPWRLTKANDKVELAVLSDSSTPSGSNALGITLPGEERRIDINQRVKIGPGTYKLTVYMDTTRCTKPRGYVMLALAGNINGKWHNFGGVATPGTPKDGWKKTEWQKYEKVVTVPEGGVIQSVLIAIVGHVTGTVMVDGISIQEFGAEAQQQEARRKQQEAERAAAQQAARSAAPQAAFQSRKFRNLFRLEETPELGLELKNPADREVAVLVQFKTADYFGKTVAQSEKTVTLPPKGKVLEIFRAPECRLPGFYCTTAIWRTQDCSGRLQASFVKVGPVPEKKDPLFGINNPAMTMENAERLELLAVGSCMNSLIWTTWFNAKPEKFAQYEKFLAEVQKRGIDPIVTFMMSYGRWKQDEWKRWFPKGKVAPGQAEPTIQELEEVTVPFIERVVTMYKPYIKTWFLGGEVEAGAQKYASALPTYIEMIKFTSDAIRRADPEATVQGIGIGGFKEHPFFPFMPKILPYVQDRLDGIAPDIYPSGFRYGKGYMTQNSEESGFRAGMLKLAEMAKVTRKGYVSCAEGGPCIVRTTPLDDPCGVSMANTQARQYILLKTVPNVRHWCYFRMDNWNPKYTMDWGMWEKDDPRQVVSAYAATARIMAFAEFVKELPLHQDMPCWIFKKDGRYFAALWYNGKEELKTALPAGIKAEALDVQGNPIDLSARTLTLGEAPVYLYAESAEALEKLLANAAGGVSELVFMLDRQEAGKTILMIRNRSGHPIELNLKSAELPGGKTISYQDRFTLAAGEVKTVEKPIGAESVAFRLETDKGRPYTASATLKPVPVPRVSGFAELEKKAVPQKLDDPSRQIRGYDDLKWHGLYTGLDDLSGEFRLGYDDRYLYIEVRVKDDIHRNDEVPGRIFRGDCIQFAVDTRRDAGMKLMRGVRGYSDDDFNFVAALASGTPQTRCFEAPKTKRAKLLNQNYAVKPEITRDEKAKTTLYRVKVAFADLAPFQPEKGRNFGFSMLFFDKDEPNSYYEMAFSPGVSDPCDPSQYPAFQFE